MKAGRRQIFTWIAALQIVFALIMGVQSVRAETNISETYKYAWSENTGWQNWHSANGEAAVNATYLTGYVWAENIGWIKLGADAGGPYANNANTNWGVNLNAGTGALSGYAWVQNAGWINFNPTNGGVNIEPATGKFHGYAWGENIGWIHFQNASPEYYVQTDPLSLYYRSAQTGNWSDTATWQQSSDGSNWVGAIAVPDQTSAGTTIRDGHAVTVDVDVTTDQFLVESGATVSIGLGNTLTVADGTGTDLTVEGNLANSGTLACADDSMVVFSGAAASTVSGAGTWTFKTLTLNKDASDTKLTINTSSDVTVSTALTVTRGSIDLFGWPHNLLLGGALSIGTDGRWIRHGSDLYCLQFYGGACTLDDQSDGGPQNLGHIKVE